MPIPGASKYKAKPTEFAGVRYASIGEAKHAERLEEERKAGAHDIHIPQVTCRLGVPENKIVVDWFVVSARHPSPRTNQPFWYVEYKGMETPKFRRDKKLWRKYGDAELRVFKGKKCVEIIVPEHLEA